MSGASLYIKKDLNITDVQLEILMGILSVYSLIGSFAAGRTSDWIGRRYTIVFAASIFFAGAFLMGFAVNYAMLMFGRFVAGVGVGYALMIAPVYTAEVSPASARGFLTSFPEVFINLGILLGYVSNYAFSHLPLRFGWRVMLGIGAAPSVVLALVVLGMPESPRWLVMKGRLADAKVVLGKTSDTPEEAAERLEDIKAAAGIPAELDGDVVAVPKKESSEEARVWKELILSPTPVMRRILLTGLGIHFFQQSSGIDAVVLYSPRVFKAAGITSDNQLLGTTCAVGVTKTLFILVATFLLDKAGRRPLLLSSVGGMVLSLAGLAAGLTVIGHSDAKVPWAIGVAIASTMAYVAFFSIGLGPITWVYSSEIFPLQVRALGCALGVATNRVTSGVVSMTFISLSNAITIGGAFFLYGGIAALAWVFFFTFLPETRGRTLEGMSKLFGAADEDDLRAKPQDDKKVLACCQTMDSSVLPESVESTKHKSKSNAKYAFTCAICASMASVILGYDIGVMSGASLYIKKDLKITDVQLEILMGIMNLYSLIGAFAAGRTSDWIGRRLTVVFAAAIFFTGALLMGFSVNYAMLMAGRFVAGVGVGYAIMIAPVYTAEISPAASRGFLTSFPDFFINLGILLGYVSNYAFARLPLYLGWRVMLGIGAAPSMLLALMVFVLPESPRWLVKNGRLADARAVLEKTSGTPEEAAARLADIKAAAGIPKDLDGDVVSVPNTDRNSKQAQVWKELVLSPTPAMRRILLSALGIHFFQQASGSDCVVLYSPRVFKSAGITDDNQLLGTTCAVGVTKTLFIVVAALLLDRVGRRPLLLCSAGGMMASLIGLGTGLTVVGHHESTIPWAVALCIASTLAYVAFFSIGLGPITGVYTSEIFPLQVRAMGFAVGVACNRFTSGVISMTFLSLSKAITIGGSFLLYAGIAALGCVFFFTNLPETRGRTLEGMGKLFGMADTAMSDKSMTEAEGACGKENVIQMAKVDGDQETVATHTVSRYSPVGDLHVCCR
ncbi:hypothetical protein BS78_02G328600 [Paspalum vaginatum]|nr:hypothetical protein BS78_02G328600 [Paspalum vaginatum]